jgi:tetratricopeptide (TPR) repeat protein
MLQGKNDSAAKERVLGAVAITEMLGRIAGTATDPAPSGHSVNDPLEAARRAVQRDSSSSRTWENLGCILAERGSLGDSSMCLARSAQLDPDSLSAFNNLAVVFQRAGRLKEASGCYQRAMSLAPDSVEIHMNFAALQGELGLHDEGLQIVQRFLDREPGMVRGLLLAAALQSGAGRYESALSYVERAMVLKPGRPDVMRLRAELYLHLGRYIPSLNDCNLVLAENPDDPKANHIRALALQSLGRTSEALEAYARAESNTASPATIVADRAWLLAELGQKREAIAGLDHALRLQPELSLAWYRRSHLSSRDLDGADLATMHRLATAPGRTDQDCMNLSFALGKIFLDRRDGERAFPRLDLANKIKRSTIDYDLEAEKARFAELVRLFSKENVAALSGSGDPSQLPIFVFGMPRSGTTLVEQILASHPEVHGAGESPHFGEIAEAPGFLEGLPSLEPEQFKALGRRYVDSIRAAAPKAGRIVDKMTCNFLFAGLIPLLLPNARMIHCRRDPLDTCLSCYSLLFTRGHEYCYDQHELGSFYRLYLELMEHWRSVLPQGTLFEVDYENLIESTEDETRRLLDFCSLEWDPVCLRFHETQRAVTTASLMQVRSPIYRSSVRRAQEFRPWLGVLERALEGQP